MQLHVASQNVHLMNVHGLSLFCPDASHSPSRDSTSKLGRDHFKLDIALMFTNRDINFRQAHVRFAWADSSPQGPFDFLMWRELVVAIADLLTVAKAIRTLQQTYGGVLFDHDDPDVPLATLRRRVEINEVLTTKIKVQVYAPTTMGQGHTGAEDNLSCSLHKFILETCDLQHLFRHVDEY